MNNILLYTVNDNYLTIVAKITYQFINVPPHKYVPAYKAILHVFFIKGESGANSMKGPFGSPDDAIKDFKKKFQDKTGNKWENRDSFTPKTKKYTMIEMSLEDEDETDAPAPVCLHYYITALHSVRAGIFTLLRLSSPFCTRRYFYIITSCTALHSVFIHSYVPRSLRKKVGELDICLTENLAMIFISF